MRRIRLGAAYRRLYVFARSEPLLVVLAALAAALVCAKPGLVYKAPALLDPPTLAVLACLLAASQILNLSGMFSAAALAVLRLTRGSSRTALVVLALFTAGAAALIMNDAAMFIAVPVSTALAEASGEDRGEAAAVTAVAANAGSSLTPVGSPQNIYIWTRWRPSFPAFTVAMAPYVALWLSILLAYLLLKPAGKAPLAPPPGIHVDAKLGVMGAVLLAANIILADLNMWLAALAVTLLAILPAGRKALRAVDWPLVALFAFMFFDFNSISLLAPVPPIRDPLLTVVAGAALSQAISNVPATLILAPAAPSWLPLAVGVNLGGLGTVVGSLANFIAVRLSGATLAEFHRYTLPIFAVATAGTLLLFAGSI